jgi:hypothetical protein
LSAEGTKRRKGCEGSCAGWEGRSWLLPRSHAEYKCGFV